MNILFVISSLMPGGAERQCSLLCNAWAAQGHSVAIATFDEGADHYGLSPSISRIHIRKGMAPVGGLRQIGQTIWALRKIIKSRKPDVVISFLDIVNFMTIIATRGLRIPTLVSERSVPGEYDKYRSRAILTAAPTVRRWLYPLADALIVQTRAVEKWALENKISKNPFVIPNILERQDQSPKVSREKTILTVGRLSDEKGHDILVEAFAMVAHEFPDWRLRLVGGGPNLNALEYQASRLGVSSRVTFAGPSSNIEAEYARAGIFVLPSRTEGFPNALLEAMRGGCASIAADCPVGPGEIITHGVDGHLFTNCSADDLAGILRVVIANGGESLGENARSTAEKYYPGAILPLWDKALADAVRLRNPSYLRLANSSQGGRS